ncbi:hypothetical protein B0H14DRAFT_2840617 [Mycena olivaceomarginata]|nr:hypothetical protein B0H14DRAFT_2840617 [Mycena olivaceomarginata]
MEGGSNSAAGRRIPDCVLVPTLSSLRRDVNHITSSEISSAAGAPPENHRAPGTSPQSCGNTKRSQNKQLIYPDVLDHSNLPGRVKGLAQYLNFMVNDAEVLALSPVWTSFLADIDYKIVQFCKSPSKAKFTSAIRGKRCGYYGQNGASAIETEILAMLVVKEEQLLRTVCHTVEETLRAHTWNQFDGYDAAPDPRQFVTLALTPFVATMLIQEDMGMVYSMNEANAIRRATSILDGGIQPIDTGISYSAHVIRASEAHALQRARSTFEDEMQPIDTEQLSECAPFAHKDHPGRVVSSATFSPASHFGYSVPCGAPSRQNHQQLGGLRPSAPSTLPYNQSSTPTRRNKPQTYDEFFTSLTK